MLLEGVPIDERHIAELADLLPTALANKLTVARRLGSQVVRLSVEEREQIVSTLEHSPGRLDDDLRYLILRQTSWRHR